MVVADGFDQVVAVGVRQGQVLLVVAAQVAG